MVAKRKRTLPSNATDTVVSHSNANVVESECSEPNNQQSITGCNVFESETRKQFCFKDPKYEASKGGLIGKKQKTWKTLKQICAAERVQTSVTTDESVTYGSIDAPPSFKPAKKYSDISGLPAHYTDPHTKLRYASAEEFSRVRMLPIDIVAGLLQLRKANIPTA